jgi:hypothetical protein
MAPILRNQTIPFFIFAGLLLIGTSLLAPQSGLAEAPPTSPSPSGPTFTNPIYLPLITTSPKQALQVNTPYFEGEIRISRTAVFWFGEVTPRDNYADVRVGYNDEELSIRVSVIDRRLWYSTNPLPSELTLWDAVSVYLNLDGDVGDTPGPNAYHLVGQLKWWQAEDDWQTAFQGDGSQWIPHPLSFTTERVWRGNAPNDNLDDHGWWIAFTIPFESLGLNGPPTSGTRWGLGVKVHDRDDLAHNPIPDQAWPENMNAGEPSTWGRLIYGLPSYSPPASNPEGNLTIRHGMNGDVVPDADVGGTTLCGGNIDYWSQWGQANYGGLEQINVQNQADISDWPCFSKYYLSFPLDAIPHGKVIRSATLRLHQFGNAGQGWNPAPIPSLIQVFTTFPGWEESTITWNNAPPAKENISRAWVDPLASFPGWPGIPREWDVTMAVAEAYSSGASLDLALYSPDGAIHSGKYFYSSEADVDGRPTLEIEWGSP